MAGGEVVVVGEGVHARVGGQKFVEAAQDFDAAADDDLAVSVDAEDGGDFFRAVGGGGGVVKGHARGLPA